MFVITAKFWLLTVIEWPPNRISNDINAYDFVSWSNDIDDTDDYYLEPATPNPQINKTTIDNSVPSASLLHIEIRTLNDSNTINPNN